MATDFTSTSGGDGTINADVIQIGGVPITASAAELNLLDGTSRILKVAIVTLGTGTSGGGVGSWANPETSSVLISRILVDITTQSSGASTLDIGTTATSATTSSDNLIDGASGAAAGVLDNLANAGTNGKTVQKLAAGKWVTLSQASGAVAGLAGKAYIFYTPI